MFAARSQVRLAARTFRVPPRVVRHNGVRSQSTTSSASSGATTHIAAGVAGGLVGGGLLYLAFAMTPSGKMTRAVNQTARDVNKKYKEASKKLQESTPDADQAVNMIKEFCYSYVSWIPGGRGYVDTAFRDYDTIRDKHGDEVKKIVGDGYQQLADLAKSSPKLNMDTVTKTYDILANVTSQMAELTADAASDLIDNHPELKDKLGDSVHQLKSLSEQYGPEAKKQLDDTWAKAKEIVAGGLSAANVSKLQKLFEEKRQQLGDQLWNQALEKAQPYLDKNPEVGKAIKDNAEALKKGNVQELLRKAKEAVESKDLGQFQDYIRDTTANLKKKAESKTSGSLDPSRLFEMLPQGKELQPKLQKLMEVAKDNADEGQKLLKETIEELKGVIEEKSKAAEKLVKKAGQQAK